MCLGEAAKACCTNDHIMWRDSLRRLRAGIPTGSRISGDIAAAYAPRWKRLVVEKCQQQGVPCPWRNGRYVDDNLAFYSSSQSDFEKFIKICNSIDSRVQVTFITTAPGQNQKISHLNFRAWVSSSGQCDFAPYRKPTAGRGCPRIDSAISFRSKKASIQEEVLNIYKTS